MFVVLFNFQPKPNVRNRLGGSRSLLGTRGHRSDNTTNEQLNGNSNVTKRDDCTQLRETPVGVDRRRPDSRAIGNSNENRYILLFYQKGIDCVVRVCCVCFFVGLFSSLFVLCSEFYSLCSVCSLFALVALFNCFLCMTVFSEFLSNAFVVCFVCDCVFPSFLSLFCLFNCVYRGRLRC